MIMLVENLRKERITYDGWYIICKHSEDSVNHILPHCQGASKSIVGAFKMVQNTMDHIGYY